MRIVIVGAGSIGKRHAGNLCAMGCQNLAFLRRTIQPVKEFPDIPVYDQLQNVVTEPGDLIIICNPSPFHIEAASRAIDHGCHVFIEKPLSNDWQGVEAFLEKASRSMSLIWVGYDLRFDTGLKLVKQWIENNRFGRPLVANVHVGQYLPDWRPEQDYTDSITARKDLGGGVLLELSHELDFARWLLGPVKRVVSVTRNIGLKMDVEDTALALIDFQSGALCSVHLDCLQRTMNRKCLVVCSDAVIHWDYCAQSAWATGPENRILERITWETEDRNTRFRREMSHVLRCIEGKEQPLVSANEGAESLRLILAIKEAGEIQEFIDLSKG